MKTRLIFTLLLLTTFGCSTFEKRAEDNAELFASLDAETQDKLRQGMVEVGYTPDMVFIALGAPDSRSERITAESREKIWIYSTYYTEYTGTDTVGYQRIVNYDPTTKSYFVHYEPVRVDHYQNRTEDRIRITFRDDKVAVIEKAK